MAGESAGIILVNSSEKLLTSNSFVILGVNGAGIAFRARSSQFVPCGDKAKIVNNKQQNALKTVTSDKRSLTSQFKNTQITNIFKGSLLDGHEFFLVRSNLQVLYFLRGSFYRKRSIRISNHIPNIQRKFFPNARYMLK
jgi:hypothetical protein